MYKQFFQDFFNFFSLDQVEIGKTEKEVFFEEDNVKVFHYKPIKKFLNKIPVLITYSFVNRPSILDLDEDRSMIKKLLELGIDVYIIDWGYPDHVDKYCTLDDYVNNYIDNCVDIILAHHKLKKINLLGICQGATLNTIYAAINPDKVQNLINIGMPFKFDIDDGLLFKWNRNNNVDNFVESFGLIPGKLITSGFMMVKPFEYSINRYMDFFNKIDDDSSLKHLLSVNKWLLDSPSQPGEMYRDFIKELYIENKLFKNQLVVGKHHANIRNIKMPVLCANGTYDKIVPPSSTRPFMDAISSTDKVFMEYPVDHIELFIKGENNNDMIPFMANWLKYRDR